MNYLAVSYLVDGTRYGNVGKGTAARSQRTYWRDIAVMFASARKVFAQPCRFLVFTNSRPHGSVAPLLRHLDVELVGIPFRHEAPSGYYPRYGGAFHLFDVAQHFADRITDGDHVLIADPDCLWITDPQPLLDVLRRDAVLGYSVGYPADYLKFGVSRRVMGDIFADVSGRGSLTRPPTSAGSSVASPTPGSTRRCR